MVKKKQVEFIFNYVVESMKWDLLKPHAPVTEVRKGVWSKEGCGAIFVNPDEIAESVGMVAKEEGATVKTYYVDGNEYLFIG